MACRCAHPPHEICPQCDFEPFVRNHFFTGKLMGAADFTAESYYHAEKLRHHNVRLHGWGVVCGLRVHQHPSEPCRTRYVVVESGSALDCCGHEIFVPEPEILDVGEHPTVLAKTQDGQLHMLQLVACHLECPTEEVPVLYDECGCDDTQCAPNRILESYRFDVLVDPALADGLGTSAALGSFSISGIHGATGWLRASAGGKVAIVDPGSASQAAADIAMRVFVLDVLHRSLISIELPAKARAIALSADGDRLYVAVEPFGGTTECQILVYKTADGSPVPPVAAGAIRKVPGSSATTLIALAATSDNNSELIAYEATSGNAHPWKFNSSAGIEDTPGSAFSVAANGKSFTATSDGKLLFAIDQNGKVQVRDVSTASPTALGGLGTTAAATALAPFKVGANVMLAVAIPSEKRVYLVGIAPSAAGIPVDLAHTPHFVGVAGPDAAPWLTVYEEDAGHAYVQSVALQPLATAGQPLIGAPRFAGDAPPLVVIVHADGQTSIVDPSRFADSDCSDLVDLQSLGCPGCETAECVPLATLSNYRHGFTMLDLPAGPNDLNDSIARLDHSFGRRILASTATLQAWLECLQLKGGVPGPRGPIGPIGPEGPASLLTVDLQMKDCEAKPEATLTNGKLTIILPTCCGGDLTRICATNWVHGDIEASPMEDLIISFTKDIKDIDPRRLQEELRHSFIVETHHEATFEREFKLECWCQLPGKYEQIRLPTACKISAIDAGPPFNAIRFVPKPRILPNRSYRIRLVGDLILDANGNAIDANHLPEWMDPSGDRRSGDCIKGGVFYSWFHTKR